MPYRYFIVGITSLAALWMYIDRVCFSTLADPAQADLGGWRDQKEFILSAFFFTYALFQIPMGTLADVFGQRLVLTISIAAWSLVTAATGFVDGFFTLLIVRLLLGITESGAYPAAAGLVKNWALPSERGRFSSAVALGGRSGGAAAPYLTAWLAVALAGVAIVSIGSNPSGVNWRGVFILYGLCGLIVAVLFWIVVRDRPRAAPGVAAPPKETFSRRMSGILRGLGRMVLSGNMWYFGLLQFGVNLGWAFVVTLLPTYLKDIHHASLESRGQMQSVVLITGCVGMILGGIITDGLWRWLGPRKGRSLPVGLAMTGCAAALFLVPILPNAWAVVAALGMMAFLVDMSNPSIWSFAQDVGGRNVGAALGWGNMLGNFGAAASPLVIGQLSRSAGWDATFMVCGAVFAGSALCGFLLDATKPVDGEGAT
jgi:MFS family permease